MANKQSGGTRLTGINPLSYMGVEPVSPPQLVRYQVHPTNRDFNFNIGDLWLVESPFEVWMLLEKPQNVAFWALIYPQAGGAGGISLIHTDAGDVIADVNGEIGIQGGENINIGTSGPNIVIVNLNRTIQWPTTNTAGTEGVIYLGGSSFLHNYGDLGLVDHNTFLGELAGNFTLASRQSVGIGAISLNSLITGNRNTGVGYSSLTSVTTGSDNIGIGHSAGAALTGSDSRNICIYHTGVSGDTGVIRIGSIFAQDRTFISGINGATVAGTVTPNTVLNVDDQGQIGQVELTSSGATIAITQPSNGVINLEALGGGGGGNPFAFSYVQDGDSAAIANGTDYEMGANIALTQFFDVGNNFFPGDGAGDPARFTAPVTGKYYFEFIVKFATAGINATVFTQSIITTGRTYQTRTSDQAQSLNEYTVVTDMAMGEEAFFTLINPVYLTGPSYIVSGNGGAQGSSNINSTRISGFLIPEGASGGSFSQPFLGIQQVDTGNVTGDGTVYLLGSAAPIVEQFDIGNNFTPGDGVGTPATFTAPDTGIYVFNVFYVNSDVSGLTITTETGYILINGIINPYYYASDFTAILSVSVFAPVSLTIGDVVTFSFVYQLVPSALSVKLLATKTFQGSIVNTYITGYRLA